MNYHRLLITTPNKSLQGYFLGCGANTLGLPVYTFKEASDIYNLATAVKPAKGWENQHYALKLDLMPSSTVTTTGIFRSVSVLTGQPGAEATAKLLLSFGVGGPGGRPGYVYR